MVPRSSFALTRLSLVALAAAPALPAQAPARFTLDIPTIMRGPEHYGREPSGISWTPDSRYIRFTWAPPGTAWNGSTQSYRVRAEAGAVPEVVTGAMTAEMSGGLGATAGVLSRDGQRKLFVAQGSIWLWDVAADSGRRLSQTAVTPQILGWSADETGFHYRTGDAVYAFRLADGFVQQLAEFRPAAAGPTATGPGQAASPPSPISAALQRDQRMLFDALQGARGGRGGAVPPVQQQQQGARGGAGGRGGQQGGRGMGAGARGGMPAGPAAAVATEGLKVVTLPRGETLRSLSLSPGGQAILFITGTSYTSTPTLVPRWITASGYVETSSSRAKVGDAGGTSRLASLDLATGQVTWLQPLPGDTSNRYTGLGVIGWNDRGTTALVTATSGDYKLRIISGFNPATGTLTPLETLRDSTWIGGPNNSSGWLPGQDAFWFVNESDGYAHLYTMQADGSNRRQLTRGEFEVLQIRLARDKMRFEMHTSEGSPFEKHFWTMNLDGSNKVRHTRRAGSHDVTISPDGRWYAVVYSYSNEPPELYLQAASPDATPTRITTSPTAAWRAHKWLDPEIVMIPASDGKQVPARIYRPKDVGAKANGAAVIFVHGAGYLHNVHRYWSSYAREYMFHHLLAQKGYVVLDLDFRASAGYGHDWRTAIHRWMGGRDLQDHVDASRWLKRTYGISGERVGIYGGSYGGFITLMALFTAPEHFGAGAALRSVTDWAHYNHGYTAPILGLPQEDSLAYARSSPIHFAAGLQDPLLMAHGMVDSNVQYQDIIRLTQRLIELGKTGWELASYPVEDHGFTRPDSWTDEYRRILDLFDRTIARKR